MSSGMKKAPLVVVAAVLWTSVLLVVASSGEAQQFNSDNQWTAPHGAGTFVLTWGEEYSNFIAVAALRPDWEFNVGVTRFREDPDDPNDDHFSGTFYVKRRFWENEAENGGVALLAGTGYNPSYLSDGEVTDTFQSWWATGVYSMPFRDGDIGLDLMPGVILNTDKDRTGENTFNFTYSSRVAIYKIIPQSAIVGEVFGTVGEAHVPAQYRAGVRWESPHVIIAVTYGGAFDGSGGAGFEIGAMYLTNPLKIFCMGGGCS